MSAIGRSLQAKINLALGTLLLGVCSFLFVINHDTQALFDEVARVENISDINGKVLELTKTVESMQRNVTLYGVSGSKAVFDKLISNNEHIHAGLISLQEQVADTQMRQMIDDLLILSLRYQENLKVLPMRYRMKANITNNVLPSLYQSLDDVFDDVLSGIIGPSDKSTLLQARVLWAKANHSALLFLTRKEYSQRQRVASYTQQLLLLINAMTSELSVENGSLNKLVNNGVLAYLDNFDKATQANRNYFSLVNVVMGGDAAEFAALADSLTRYTSEKYAAMQESITLASSENRKHMLIAIILFVALCLLLAILFHVYVIRAIKSLVRTFDAFIRGDFSVDVSLQDRQDEIGLLAQAAAEFKAVSLNLISAKTEAEHTTRIKSEFLANMSHEIRTPMNGILGMAQTLKHSPLNDEQKEMLALIDSSGKSLLSILNDILDLSKLEANKVELDYSVFSFADICYELKNMFCSLAEQKGIELNIPDDDNLRTKINSDSLRIKQVLINLLSNAIKFTEKGSVSLIIEELKLEEDFITYRIKVEDTGVGIPESAIHTLTDAFTQADTSITRNFGGTGLGLAISSNILSLLDSKIEIDSQLDEGATFYFTLKLLRAKKDDETIQQDQVLSTTHLKQLKILIVDDNDINQIVLENMLNILGQEDIQTAANGVEALEILQRDVFNLVFMDVQMPIMDGISATKAIRENDALQHLYIVGLSANVMQEDKQKCFESGMDAFLGKPLIKEELMDTLELYFTNSKHP